MFVTSLRCAFRAKESLIEFVRSEACRWAADDGSEMCTGQGEQKTVIPKMDTELLIVYLVYIFAIKAHEESYFNPLI